MEYRKLGNTDLKLSEIGIGTWAIGSGGWKYAWGDQQDSESIKAIHCALEHGVNWIDTAAVYGIGHAEKIVKEAIKGVSKKPLIATKCGLLEDKNKDLYSDISRKSILKEVDQSLKRLGVEKIDIYQIHWPNPTKDIEEAFQTLLELKEAGKITYPAVSNFSLQQLERISKLGMPVSLQSPYSLIRPELSYDIIPWCIQNEVSVFAYSPLQCGLLTSRTSKDWLVSLTDDDWRKSNKYFTDPMFSKILESVEDLKIYMQESHPEVQNPVISAALRWVLSNPGVTSAIVGMRSQKQAEELINCLDFNADQESINKIAQCFSRL